MPGRATSRRIAVRLRLIPTVWPSFWGDCLKRRIGERELVVSVVGLGAGGACAEEVSEDGQRELSVSVCERALLLGGRQIWTVLPGCTAASTFARFGLGFTPSSGLDRCHPVATRCERRRRAPQQTKAPR